MGIERVRLSLFERWMLFVTLLFMFSEVFMGVLRHYLSNIGLAPLVYLPKMLVFLTLLVWVGANIWRGRISKLYSGTLLFIGFFALIGLFYTEGALQVAFGIYTLGPFLLGLLALPVLLKVRFKLKPYVMVLWLLAVAGVLLDLFYDLPWAGAEYELGEISMEASRAWTTGGFERLAGFSRLSFNVSIQILLLGLFLVTMEGSHWYRVLLIWLITGAAIILTTSKSATGVYLILTFFFASRTLLPYNKFGFSLIVLTIIIGIMLPISSLMISYQFNTKDLWSEIFFASFGLRLMFIWPAGFDLIANYGSLWFGRGIGGISAAQKYFEPFLYHPSDNFYLYLYVTMGLGMFIFVAAYIIGASRLNLKDNPVDVFFFTVIWSFFMVGSMLNVMEMSIFPFVAGLSLRYVFLIRRDNTTYSPAMVYS